MKIIATVLMASAVMAGCSNLGNTQRNNAVDGDKSEAKRTTQSQTSNTPMRASDGSPTMQRNNATEGNASEAPKTMQNSSYGSPMRSSDGSTGTQRNNATVGDKSEAPKSMQK